MSRLVHCFPSADPAFCDAATNALAGIDRKLTGDDVAWALADLLRPTYPAVAVHRQDEFARVGDFDVWYAYRDGKL